MKEAANPRIIRAMRQHPHPPASAFRAFLCAAALTLHASTALFAERLPIRAYTMAEGLPSDTINKIVQDSRGYLWFCTPEGLSRFDGYQFVNYGSAEGLPGTSVEDLLEARDGSYWAATDRGLARMDPSVEGAGFVSLNLSLPVAFDPVRVVFQDSGGVIWAGTWGDLFRLTLKGDKWERSQIELTGRSEPLYPVQINALLDDGAGGLWVGTRWAGLYHLGADGRQVRYSVGQGLPIDNVRSIIRDREGTLWVGTRKGLCRLRDTPDADGRIVQRVYREADGLPTDFVGEIFQTRDGVLQAATSDGLALLRPDPARPDEKIVSRFTKAQGLGDDYLLSVREDRDGNLWLGSISSGAMKISPRGFVAFGEADGIGTLDSRALVLDRQGRLLLLSRNQTDLFLSRLDDRKIPPIRLSLPMQYKGWGHNQGVAQTPDGEWWVATGAGLARFSATDDIRDLGRRPPSRVYTKRDGLACDDIYGLFADSHGRLWSSCGRLEPGASRFTTLGPESGYTLSMPSAFTQDSAGSIWIGAYAGGVARFRHGKCELFQPPESIPRGIIEDMFVDSKGRLWIATSVGGVARCDDPLSDTPRFVTLSRKDGLSSDAVSCVQQDTFGRIYLCTGRGVDRLDPETGIIKHFTTSDGLQSSTPYLGQRDRAGDLWFGMRGGVARLTPSLDEQGQPPPVFISALKTASFEFGETSLGRSRVGGLVLGPDEAHVEIEFVGLGFGPGEGLTYQHRLEGIDRDWSAPSAQRSINYGSLGPGTYRFLVRAQDSAGRVSESPAEVAFAILPPFWMRGWFIFVAGAALTGMIFTAHRVRVRRLLELERVRSRIATDLHDDVGATLSQVAILSEVALSQIGQKDDGAAGPLRRIASISREMVDTMSDIVWSIDPHRDRLTDLTNRMRRFAGDVCGGRGIDLVMDVPEDDQPLSLGPDIRRQVLLVFKEAVNNAVRHSGCTMLTVSFGVEGVMLALTVADNGTGRAAGADSDGHGLASMRRRAESLAGTCDVTSTPGEGTILTFRVPLKHGPMKANPV